MKKKVTYYHVTLANVNWDQNKLFKVFEFVNDIDQWFGKPRHFADADVKAQLSYPEWEIKIQLKTNNQTAIDFFDEKLEKVIND